MALNAGAQAAGEMVDYAPSKHFNFVTTYWRGTNSTDWTNELGYLLSGGVMSTTIYTSTIYNYMACFSTATFTNLGTNAATLVTVTNGVDNQGTFQTQMGAFMATMTNFATGQWTNIPLLGDDPNTSTNRHLSPAVGWVYINQDIRTKAGSTNTTNIPVVRFAFYVQDLSSLIDATRMGSTINYRTNTYVPPTNYVLGTNPAEISLANAAGTSLTNATKFSALVLSNNRFKYLSPGMLTLSNVGGLSTNDLRYVTVGLRHWTNVDARIPIGLGYINSTSLKTNLNSPTLTSNSVTTLAPFIQRNLTNIRSRAGGMSSNAYVSNIAANIVDYVDTDSNPTTDNLTSPTYIGIENIPWPNELFDALTMKNAVNGPPAQIRLQLKDMVEVWNMGNKEIPTGTSISISNNYDMKLTFTNSFLTPPVSFTVNLKDTVDVDNGNAPNWTRYRTFTTTSPILPNGYAVLQSDKAINGTLHFTLGVNLTNPAWVSTNPTAKLSWFMYTPSTDRTDKMTYSARFGTKVIQKSSGGRWPHYLAVSYKIDSVSGAPFVFCNPIGYASQTSGTGAPTHSGGDPRAQYFLSGALRCQNYVPSSGYPNSYASPGGRNIERDNYLTKGFQESEVNPAKYWPDQGHAATNDWGSSSTAYSDSPLSFSKPSTSAITNNYVMVRNDSGTFTNICELGNIYDPMQWSDQSGSGVSGQPGLWTNLTAAATPSTLYGGRTTLRIGRPEFTRFAFTNLTGASVATPNMMASAAGLLDLFCTTNQYDESGLVNLNTAPAPVLRALAGGVGWNKDPAQLPTANRTLTNGMAEAFAQGVMRFRAKYPFYSPSQLAFIGTDSTWPNTNSWPSNAVFGNTNKVSLVTNSVNSLTSTSLGITEWSDQAAEEWFSKIYGLSTTQSRNYRCYVIAQLVNSNKVPIGPVVRKYYDIATRQNNDTSSTNLPSTSTLILYEAPY
jgi:hypothetical protein